MGDIEKFQQERAELNELVMKYAGLGTKRFYSLDSQAYREGALPVKTIPPGQRGKRGARGHS